jgi:hypothetical protein
MLSLRIILLFQIKAGKDKNVKFGSNLRMEEMQAPINKLMHKENALRYDPNIDAYIYTGTNQYAE